MFRRLAKTTDRTFSSHGRGRKFNPPQNVEPHDIAILVRMHANEVEADLARAFTDHGLRLRNEARNVGDIAIQDLLGEELTAVCLPLLRLGATNRSADDWNATLTNMRFLKAVDPADDLQLQKLQDQLSKFIRELRRSMRDIDPDAESAATVAQAVIDFIGIPVLRQAFPAYQRAQDFDRVREGLVTLLRECAEAADDWQETLDKFEGLGQIALMTIHKSKGLEFHTMIFYGLDNQTWWSLTPNRTEELNSFFVAFTRAKQRAFFTFCTERGQAVSWIEDLLAPAGLRHIDGANIVRD
jgi:UvrD-like helicase C-terminal domain